MLMVLNDDDVFNLFLPLDTAHNALWDTVRAFNNERTVLFDRLRADNFIGNVGQITLNQEQKLTLRPQMIVVNDVIDQLCPQTKQG